MTRSLIDLAAERRRRERFEIALAGLIFEMMHADPEDPTPLQFDIAILADELRLLPASEIDFDYRNALARFANEPDLSIAINGPGLEKHHVEALAWARGVIAATRSDIGESRR